jgi:hypothetical protein
MGKIRFGNLPNKLNISAKIPEFDEQVLAEAYSEDSIIEQAPTATMLPPVIEYREVEKIIYVDKPVEVIKEVVKYVDVIKEVPVEVIKYVDKEVIKEVPVEVVKFVEKEVIVEKEVTSIAAMVTVVILGLALIGAIASGTF